MMTDFTCEEKHVLEGHIGQEIPSEIAAPQAIALKLKFYRTLPPHSLPGKGSPLWCAMRKLHNVCSYDRCLHRSVHDLFWTVVNLGGSWISLDDPMNKDIGFSRNDGSQRQAIYICRYKETVYRWNVPDWFRQKMNCFSTRPEIAHLLSVGDHCLEFDEKEVPWIVKHYVRSRLARNSA